MDGSDCKGAETIPNTTDWWPNWSRTPVAGFYHYLTWLDPRTPQKYEMMAYGAMAMSSALGAQSGVGGPFAKALQVNLNDQPFAFGSEHPGHSGQFRSDIQTRHVYWEQLLRTLGYSQ